MQNNISFLCRLAERTIIYHHYFSAHPPRVRVHPHKNTAAPLAPKTSCGCSGCGGFSCGCGCPPHPQVTLGQVPWLNHNIPGRLPTTSRGCPQPQIAPCQNPCGFKSRANHNPTTAKTFEPAHLSVQRRRPQRISGGASLAITNPFRVIVLCRKYGRI